MEPHHCAPDGADAWWRNAVIYQVYPRSFADADGDGVGDLAGIRSRLPYLADLGVDAVWLNPFYRSPQLDAGYDVADYRQVDPLFGSVADAEALIEEAHALGLRVIFDIVPNHTSREHAWFVEAMRTPPPEGMWSRYHCRRGRGPNGAEPPNDWRSVFGGAGWSPIPDPQTGEPSGWWYLHLFDDSQPDLNWDDPEVRAEHERVLRFWFDRGVDGFRIDVAHGLVKDPAYPDSGESEDVLGIEHEIPVRPQWDQPGVHDVYRSWRRIADSYDPPRVFCGEVWVSTPESHARYLRSDELHTAFNFHYLRVGWGAAEIRDTIDHTLSTARSVGASCTWVLSNHDVWRHATRLAPFDAAGVPDQVIGLRRARAATLLMLGLPGSAYLYQGEELGLPEVLDLPAEARQDPVFRRTGGSVLGRDGCRVPIPWSGTTPSYGFGPGAASWLPQPAEWATLSVAAQDDAPESTLAMYRRALAVRHSEVALGEGTMTWCEAPAESVLAYLRGPVPESPAESGIRVVVNLGAEPVRCPEEWGGDVLVASGPGVLVSDGAVVLAPDSGCWLRA